MSAALDRLLAAPVEDGTLPHLWAVVIDDGEVAYEGGAGPPARDRLYRIASMTKALTSTAAMQLVERGRLALDVPITEYLSVPEMRVLESVGEEGEPVFRPASRPPTLRELLTHTAGYGYGIWNEALNRLFTARGLPSLGEPGARRLDAPMIADPGTAWHYSIATDFVGRIVEEASGRDLDAYMRAEIFEPLGMPDSGFESPDRDAARLMPVYRRRTSGEIAGLELPHPTSDGFRSGGGGLVSTPADYTRFLAALLGGGALSGARILERTTVEQMLANHTGDIPIPPMRSFDPAFSASHEFFPGVAKGWGLGFLLNLEDVPGRRAAGSGTWAGLYNTHFWIDPGRRIAGALMTQLLPFCDPGFMSVYDAFERQVYAERP